MPKQVKIVDGWKIRNTADIDFSMVGEQENYSYIPKNEIWLEKYYLSERDSIISNFQRRQRLIRVHGYEHAKQILRQTTQKTAGARSVIKKTRLSQTDELTVYLVRGQEVRVRLDPFFCFGGHDLVYDYIPRGEVWLDDQVAAKERLFVLHHEIVERLLMQAGKSYNNAHDFANAAEKELRRRAGVARYSKD